MLIYNFSSFVLKYYTFKRKINKLSFPFFFHLEIRAFEDLGQLRSKCTYDLEGI